MVASEEFYELPQEDQQSLVADRRVILNQSPINKIPEYGAPIRVLDKPLATVIFDKLRSSQYTISELANEIGVREKHVRHIINKHRHRRFEDLLEEYQAVLRAKDTRGPAVVYSLESVPYFARVVDPTLSCSLLRWTDELLTRFDTTRQIPGGKVTEIDEDYAFVIADYWGFDPDDAFDYLTEFNRRYVETALGPLPVVETEEQYGSVRNRFAEPATVQSRRKNIDGNTPQRKVEMFADEYDTGALGMSFFQCFSLTMFDLMEYACHRNPAIEDVIQEQLEKALEWLEPESEEGGYAPPQPEQEPTVVGDPGQSETGQTTDGSDEGLNWNERELLIELVGLTQELGGLPSETDIDDQTPYSHEEYEQQFGSLMNAFRLAGILSEGVSTSQ
ncbi:hypothetical protein NDI56_11210 [Haloarcula sp. S1CR25-12]|uniref:Helix-turn-helix domain-containing protein n=1 Tax=Haloarcula saliterrae TaxID=2950534 RepID=A0ABU2FCI0_9EURY|nr:hypothetical protein [Haloarcula sp. S1CR25-12]MDS0259963.1 hypothetical protein [Haloarcula sp. S1CR25-12]